MNQPVARRNWRTRTLSHEGFLRHANFRWARIAFIMSMVVLVLYIVDAPIGGRSGGSAYGYTLGTIGVLLIVWLTTLGIRKRAMTPGRWSLKAWTSAHVYLGLALLIIGTLHTAFDFGWNVHTLAWALMVIVIVSGMIGVLLYLGLPRSLSSNRGEMTETEMVDALRSIDDQLFIAAQPLDESRAGRVSATLAEDPFQAGALARLTGRARDRRTEQAFLVFREEARTSNIPAIAQVETLLERRLQTMAVMARHMRLRALLEVWLYVHVPMTFALIAALAAHIVAVFFYW